MFYSAYKSFVLFYVGRNTQPQNRNAKNSLKLRKDTSASLQVFATALHISADLQRGGTRTQEK